MKVMFLLVAMMSLVAREAGAQVKSLPPSDVLVFSNRVVNITNLAGLVLEGVQIDRATPEGVTWWRTNSPTSGGRVALSNLGSDAMSYLGVPESFRSVLEAKEEAANKAKVEAYFSKLERERRERAVAQENYDVAALEGIYQRGKEAGVFGAIKLRDRAGDLQIGPGFFLLPIDQKRLAVASVFVLQQKQHPGFDLLWLEDQYSGKRIGQFSKFGLELK